MKDYMSKIRRFNYMYGLEVNDKPINLGIERFKLLQDILQEEMDEGEDIAKKFGECEDMEILVDVADWLCDIMVYCSTFGTQWGIDVSKVLEIIMESNFSKLDDNNKPLHDTRGKVLKGRNYWKPEPKIKELFEKE
jgi:predicted HAD superfamily Cof-like phosphohydrolase